MILLKQSTAAIDRLGPFVDDTDFKTKETGLSIGQSDIQISKAGGAYAQTSESSPTTTHDSGGYYQIPLTATDTGTLGRLRVKLSVSGALDVWADYLVVPAAVFDAIVNGTGNGIRADVLAWIGTALSETSSGRQAGNIDTFFDNADAATAKTLDDVGGGSSGGLTALASGTAQSGTASTLALAASSTFADDELNGNVVNITGGTGAGQSRLITDYVNSTDTATVTPNWTTTPDATSTYEVVQGAANTVQIEGSDATDQLSGPSLLLSTTIATVTSQTELILTAGSADDDIYNEAYAYAVITDQSTSTQKAIVYATDWDGGTLTLSLKDAPGFTVAAGDSIDIISRPPQGATITTATAASTASSATLFTGDFFEIVQGSSKSFTINVDPSIVDATGKTPKAAFEKINTNSETAFESGTAQAGSATTIQLAASLSYADDALNGYRIETTGGAGSGQIRIISDYIGTSDTATVPEWDTIPDNTTTYSIYAPHLVSGTVNNGGSSSQSFTFELDKSETVGMAVSPMGTEQQTVNPNVFNAYRITISVPDAPNAGDCTPAGILYAKVLSGQGGVSGAQCS